MPKARMYVNLSLETKEFEIVVRLDGGLTIKQRRSIPPPVLLQALASGVTRPAPMVDPQGVGPTVAVPRELYQYIEKALGSERTAA